MDEDGTIEDQHVEIDFADILQDAGVVVNVDAVFADDMFGLDIYSYANVTFGSGERLPIAFKQVFTGN